jgi:transposase
MRRHELSDAQWALIADLMPSNALHGRPWSDHRQIVNGMMWILHTGAPWRDLPEHYGPWQTVFERFNRWRREGLLDRVLERLQMKLDREGRVDWNMWCIDGTSIRASRAAGGAAKKGTPTNPRITRWVIQEAGSGPRSTWSVIATPFPSPLT